MEDEREFTRSFCAFFIILFVLGSFVVGLAFNKDRIIFNDYLAVATINNKSVKIEIPNEYYDIETTGSGYEFRYNDELDTIDLVIHYELKEYTDN